jgi:SAM-dependent methyltransferase
MEADISSGSYWNNRYQQHETGWDMGQVSPPLKAWFEQLPNKQISILIPGCGNSYEAAWLLENGFTGITLIDIADLLVKKLREVFSQYTDPPLRLIAGDFFAHAGSYDLIIEQTFFCALAPSMRKDYIEKMSALLKPGGKLVGLLFDRPFEGGPPF